MSHLDLDWEVPQRALFFERFSKFCRLIRFDDRAAEMLIMRVKDLPNELSVAPELAATPDAFVLRGGSAIIGPDGKYIVEPVFEEEAIIISDLDLNAVDREKMTLDVSGHYSRPDVSISKFGQVNARAQ